MVYKVKNRIDQAQINSKFIQYLEIKKTFFDPKGDVYYDKEDIDSFIEKEKPGLCGGYKTVYAVFAHLDKLSWWFDLLDHLSGWDGSEKSLNEKVQLIDQEQTRTLDELFEIAIDYIRFAQFVTDFLKDYGDQDLNNYESFKSYKQSDLLNAKKGLLEILSKDDKLITLKKSLQYNVNDIGKICINKSTFCEIIESGIDSNIITLGARRLRDNAFHGLTLRFHEGKYYLYDSNSPSGDQEYENLEDLYDALSEGYLSEFELNSIQFASFSDDTNFSLMRKTHKSTMDLLNYASINDMEGVKKALENIVHINASDNMGTALHHAVRCGNLEMAEILLNKGADINVLNEHFGTPLHFAVSQNNQEMVKFLLKKGADINIVNNEGLTPVQFATKNKQTDSIRSLIHHGGASYKLTNPNHLFVLAGDVAASYHDKLTHGSDMPSIKYEL
ncbi:MAG: ankyrin repeat domain-containing protein [Gammaproteobacteria bacterium]|nr:MAG: ankyrin repeat domain-containing protein [Gammaproteobacteria bacterium]UTW41901.1 ankyrin repeat domain-containing protein [bacterium SCSIO 12844]